MTVKANARKAARPPGRVRLTLVNVREHCAAIVVSMAKRKRGLGLGGVPACIGALIGVALWLAAGASAAVTTDAQTLLHVNKCYICHDDETWKAGPAFRDVAASYRASARTANAMVRVIRKGQRSGGPWHMPPHPEVSHAQAKAMADYILSLK